MRESICRTMVGLDSSSPPVIFVVGTAGAENHPLLHHFKDGVDLSKLK